MMKKNLLFSIFAFVICSCSSVDDDIQDQFIGSWTYHQLFINDIEETLENCDKMTTLVVNANGTYISNTFTDDNNSGCNPRTPANGTWEKKGNITYTLSFDGDTNDVQIIFEGNTISLTRTEGSKTYKEIFKRN
jgi:hypothetical protein